MNYSPFFIVIGLRPGAADLEILGKFTFSADFCYFTIFFTFFGFLDFLVFRGREASGGVGGGPYMPGERF